MKQDSIDALQELLRDISSCDSVVFISECHECARDFDDDCGNFCKAFYVLDAINRAADSSRDVIGNA